MIVRVNLDKVAPWHESNITETVAPQVLPVRKVGTLFEQAAITVASVALKNVLFTKSVRRAFAYRTKFLSYY